MEAVGKLLTCDRCKEQVFLRHTSTDALDGGYTKVDKFESTPTGWYHSFDFKIDLCPKCADKLKATMNAFMEGDTHEQG